MFEMDHLLQVKGPRGGKGIEGADFVFYISAMETERCQKGMTVAYAAHCQQEAALDRCAFESVRLICKYEIFLLPISDRSPATPTSARARSARSGRSWTFCCRR